MVEAADQLVTLMRAPNEFAAGLVVAALDEEGIEAFTFGTAEAGLGASLQPGTDSVLVKVRSRDLTRAEAALAATKEAMADFDWDRVDVGERLDTLPLTPTGKRPWLASVGLVVGIIMVLVLLVVAMMMVV